MGVPEPEEGGTKAQILRVGLRRFAADGFHGTRLSDIADEVGVRRSTVLYHFPSKETLYRAVVLDVFADWDDLARQAIGIVEHGWPQVEKILRAAFVFFEERPEFVRLARREALDGSIVTQELGAALRPLFERATGWLHEEMDAGRLRRFDAAQFVLTGYGAVLSYFSDAALITELVDDDPLTAKALAVRRDHVLSVLRAALEL
jgi:TetR/AcrR family transcriptional regulator